MKKIYFFLLAMIFSTLLFAQDCVDDIEPPLLSCPSDTIVDMDEGEMGAFVNIPGITKKVDVILLFSDYTEYGLDVQSKLIATGNFSTVDISNIAYSTPSLSELLNYDAVLIWRHGDFYEPASLGNVLTEYVDAGGGLVIGALATSDVSYPSGTFVTDQYGVIVPGPMGYGPQAFLGDVHLPGHPLMNGITSFDGGLESYRSTNNNLTTGSYRIADWTDGLPLIAAKENVGPAKARRVDINFFPPTLITYGNSAWDVNTDGDLIIANALTWVAGGAIAYDNCKLVDVTNDFNNSSSLSDFYPIGSTLVTLTATDDANNSSTCSFSVTVNDTEPPVAVCKDVTVEIDSTGQATINAAEIDNVSNDNYGIETMTLDVDTFDCSMTGENFVVLTVTDSAGNSSTCTAIVTVEDNIAPAIECPEEIVADLEPGTEGTVVNYSLPMVTDNCKGIGIEGDINLEQITGLPTGSVFPAGVTTNLFEATDNAGNVSTCSFTITVEHNAEPPVVIANPVEVILYETGSYTFNQEDLKSLASGTTDNRTPFEELKMSAFPKIFVCDNLGEIIHVRLTVEDEDGNRATQWTTVTVLDTLPPMAVCQNIEVYLDENGQAVITPEQVNDTTSYDACGIESITLGKDTFNCDNLGENMVTLYVTDLSGNVGTCTAMVMVYDTLPPTAIIVADVELEVEPGVCETSIEYPEELITDNCNFVLEQTAGLGPDGIFPLGTTTETWMATDDEGNIAEISFNVIIIATNAMPTLDAVSDVIADEDTSPAAIELTGITNGIDCAEQKVTVSALADNTDLVSAVTMEYLDGESTGSVVLTLAPDMNGTSDITVTVKDSKGAMVSQTFTVTVNPVNDAPFVVNPIPDQVINASDVLKIPISPELVIVFDDADNDVLVFEIMEEGGGVLPEWAKLIGDTLVFTPMIADTGYYNIVIKATDPDGATATDTFTVHVDGYPVSSTLISESVFDVKMYPNPTNDRVNIEINTAFGISHVSVYTITGKEIMRRNFYNNHIISFSMRENVSGIYLVKMNIEGKQIVKKLVLDKK